MKLSFSTVGCPDWSWGDIVSTASDFGYNGIEIRGVGRELDAPNISEFSNEHIERTLKQLKSLNLVIPMLASSVVLSKENKDIIALGKKYIDTAKNLGAKYIRLLGDEFVHASVVDTSIVARNASELAEYASDTNVTLLIETNGIYADSEKLVKLLTHVKRDNIGVLWDIHHPYRSMGEPVRLTYKNLAQYIRHTHIKDSIIAEGKTKYTTAGNGNIPISDCVKMLENDRYNGYYSLEWVRRWDRTLEEPGVVFAQYVSYMKSL